ncbi:methionine aminopeptidase type I [Hypnocyclicus thermotrophus]|uniref:Methionine aminopeptidase n=1 Tax=Hypnocyclicus thermotrophus TaxID=1627895 RepID=A0AA46I5P4_9FUSO|nr:type I methionyl aminopeptidase [Hypnocyclicus thermotrophus]TDT70657.1 methionine aminopeptidase type I [Hypnocyclicus thermotrophus]
MVIIKSIEEIKKIKEANQLIAKLYKEVLPKYIKSGISTYEIDKIIEDYLLSNNATGESKGYGKEYGNPYPAVSCISVNEAVVHGIPSKDIILKDGDIVSIDVVTNLNGYIGDSAITYPVGEIDEESKKLLKVTEKAREIAIENLVVGKRLGDMGNAVQKYVEKNGFSVVRDFCGHGVGIKMHEEPMIPNYGRKGRGIKIENGMVLAIEPMVNVGTYKVELLSDGWTAVTKDRKRSAHFEHSVAIIGGKAVILSELD